MEGYYYQNSDGEGNNVSGGGANRPSMLITGLGSWSKTWKALSPFHKGVPDGILKSDSSGLARVHLAGTWQFKLSAIIIWLLHSLHIPLRLLGAIIEWSLNFYSFNGGFLGMLFRLVTFQGILWFPSKDSPSYYTVVGWLDPRMHLLDATAKFNDFNSKSCADLCIMAAKLAYESQAVQKFVVTNHWNMCFQKFYSCWNDRSKSNATQAFTFSDKPQDADLVVLAFRGTEPFNTDDWCTDFDFSWYEVAPELGRVHMGFLEALGLVNRENEVSLAKFKENCMKGGAWVDESLPDMHSPLTGLAAGHQDAITPQLSDRSLAFETISHDLGQLLQKHPNAKLVITGHSLGGALAVLYAGILMFRKSREDTETVMLLQRLSAIYTFGQPRVGDRAFATFMNKSLADWGVEFYRIVYCNDMVPRVPFDDAIFGFRHCGQWCFYYDCFYRKWVYSLTPCWIGASSTPARPPSRTELGMRSLLSISS